MDKDFKAKDTFYKDTYFRSRLEARWAVFFNAMEIQWVYEYKDFILPKKGRYLPDFYLPYFNMHVEVKPFLEKKDIELCQIFSEKTNKRIILLDGIPTCKQYRIFGEDKKTNDFCFFMFTEQNIQYKDVFKDKSSLIQPIKLTSYEMPDTVEEYLQTGCIEIETDDTVDDGQFDVWKIIWNPKKYDCLIEGSDLLDLDKLNVPMLINATEKAENYTFDFYEKDEYGNLILKYKN